MPTKREVTFQFGQSHLSTSPPVDNSVWDGSCTKVIIYILRDERKYVHVDSVSIGGVMGEVVKSGVWTLFCEIKFDRNFPPGLMHRTPQRKRASERRHIGVYKSVR